MTDTPPKRIWEDRMTDLTREQLEALLDGSINDHLDYDHDTGEVYLLHQGVIAESVQPCDGPLLAAAPDLARQLLATMIERDEAQAAQALTPASAALARLGQDETLRLRSQKDAQPKPTIESISAPSIDLTELSRAVESLVARSVLAQTLDELTADPSLASWVHR